VPRTGDWYRFEKSRNAVGQGQASSAQMEDLQVSAILWQMIIRRLAPTDAPEFRRLRLKALKESATGFGSSYSEEAKRPLASFKKLLTADDDNWVYGGFRGESLIGVLRLVREKGKKERHKASIYGMYVDPSERRKGTGRTLLATAIGTAKKLKGLRQIRIGVVTSNAAAIALYERAGFVEYGKEENALLISGKFHSEFLMVKKL
jgi:ribosomal protein S18 acetylase RimI-like enzyme